MIDPAFGMPRNYIDGFEGHDARIVAEDDSHVVIAIRVDKAVLQRLMPFLAALADFLPPVSLRPSGG